MKVVWCSKCLKWIDVGEKKKECSCKNILVFKKGEFKVKANNHHQFEYVKPRAGRHGKPVLY